jgi:hypothetical protein
MQVRQKSQFSNSKKNGVGFIEANQRKPRVKSPISQDRSSWQNLGLAFKLRDPEFHDEFRLC